MTSIVSQPLATMRANDRSGVGLFHAHEAWEPLVEPEGGEHADRTEKESAEEAVKACRARLGDDISGDTVRNGNGRERRDDNCGLHIPEWCAESGVPVNREAA